MQIIIQEKFKTQLQKLVSKSEASVYIYVGDLEFLKQVPKKNPQNAFALLIAEKETLSVADLMSLQLMPPYQIITNLETGLIQKALSEISSQVDRKAKIELIKVEIQRKRKELEKLNEKLNQESERQIQSLEQSHVEESQKNIKEKSLLHFLDFVQSESINEDFLSLLIKFLWKDLKKVGRLYQIGFSFKAYSDKSNIYTYDGLTEHSANLSVDFNAPIQAVTSQMASVWGRPVGRILTWELPEFSRQGFFFMEIIDQQISFSDLESYIKERLVVLSLYLDRWMIEKEYEVIIDRWKRTFNSFSGYVHVIDEEYNIFQSNYTDSNNSKQSQRCFEILAGRNEPCPECPIYKTKQSDFLLKPGLRVKTYSSEFNYNKRKYFFVIYEDITQMHLLKGQMIHSEKMSALGRLGNHLAHELNNPLTGIKSYVQSLIEESNSHLSNTIKSDLNEILKATVRSQNIIRNFINFSHKSEPKLEKIIFVDVLQNALTLLKSVLRPHRLFLDIKQTMVMANSHDLQQVLFNLIKNSCQALDQAGSIKIYEEERQNKIFFHIEDSGPGFADEIIKNMFEPFMTTKKRGEGTGLGLYLSKKLMQNMNANIEITSLMQNGQKSGAKISLIFDKI